MDIISACAGKRDAKELAFMQTSMYWMIGREWLLAMGKSTDSWTASCIDIMKSINGGVFEATPQQQENLKASLSDDGVAYLFGVDAAIKANSQFPPGTEVSGSLESCHLIPQIFGGFAQDLARKYKLDLDDNGGRLATLLGSDWSPYRTAQSTDAAYQPVLPYGIAAGIDPGKETNVEPPPKDTTPPAVGAEKKTNWTPWIIGGVAALGLGGVAYAVTRKPKPSRLATANPSGKKPKHYSLAELESMPLLSQGHFDNLYYDDGTYRVWLSRMTREDGAPYNNQVSVEKLKNGVWTEIETYRAR